MSEKEVEVKTSLSKEDEAYLHENPSRLDVANFVNALLEEKYMPEILRLDKAVESTCRLAIMTIQAILVQKNICTAEELQKASQSILEAYKKEQNQSEEDSQKSDSE